MSQYIRERWGTEQGFPRGPVYAISQSDDGYLWIGTQAGLVRFDGLNFRLVREAPGLSNGESVLGLMPDRYGNLWIRLEGSTLLRYRDGVFDRPGADASLRARITAMSQANQGDLLISVMERGTMVYNGGSFKMIAEGSALPRSPVLAVAQTPDGSVWAGTRGAGLFRFREGRAIPVTENLPDLKVNCLLTDAEGNLWAGTDEGIAKWDGSKLTAGGMQNSLGRVQVLAMARDRDRNIWAGTDSRGLLRLNDRGVSSLDTVDAGSREAVTAVFEDREGNLWTGSAGGIERLRDSAFVTYSRPEGLPSDRNNQVLVDSENRVWLAPVDGGLWWMKDGQRGRVSSDGLDHDGVYSIAGGKGELWLGRQRGGLTRLRAERGSFTSKTYTTADGLAQDSVFSVYRVRDGSVWAGTLSGGVSQLSAGGFTTYTSATGLLSNTVASILEGLDGTMWFATPEGLSALSKGRWQGYTNKDGLPSDNVYCLLEDSTGILWIGTAAGLAYRSPKGIQVPSGAPALLREQILGLEEDRHGSLWVATSNHVLRVNRQKLLGGTVSEGDLREYGLADGLRGVEGVRRQRSVIADQAGRIWFSLNRGISVVDPARLARNAAPAIVHVQTISADGKAFRLQEATHIPGGRQRITFGYTGLSLSVPERVRFRYRLDGYDSGWSEPTGAREAGYTNLPPRSYRFRVIASNPDGVWNSNEGAIAFAVDPLFWQTWWFRTGAVLACAGAILAFYRLRMRQLTRRLNLRFEERLAERTRIAQELHDTLLQGFLSASMQVHIATDSLPADSLAKPTLTRALQLMRQVIEEGRNAVRGLRSYGSPSLDLEHALSQVQQEVAPYGSSQQAIGFRVIVEGQQKSLHPLLRDDVYRIGREALINAFRHARAKNIEVELKYSPSQLRVLVRDDGCGIEPNILKTGRDGHWGLFGMRERAEQIGARLHVYSSRAAGTEVELSVPGHVAFQGHFWRGLRWFGRRNPPVTGTLKSPPEKEQSE
jgi:ligand-binding sensor domain-containing protein